MPVLSIRYIITFKTYLNSRMISIKVDGISARATIDDLEYLFEKYGKIGDIYIPKERYSKDNRGFAFIRYFDR